MVDTIKELSGLSQQLNKKSDKLNSIIAEINQKLLALNIGIEVWLIDWPLVEDDPRDYNEDIEPCAPWRSATLLGYAEADDEWQLAIKECVLTEIEQQDVVSNSRMPRPLSRASRVLRASAMSAIPNLLDQLKVRAEHVLRSIDKAEKAAEKL